ncbi:hypothetical protein [Streptomyces sp. TS71-3]|uniref:hypothetical protein n=1 Tax=Streptomyces sp. TS71-3 TaxID=2733862 RepID=UPI001B1FAF66|nr:hypothetical protein [Streptomyces sp. TS71-3]GHJ39111.1 hypothetical protein Sm713_47200 [Streptomyces sp. TS71-3]
MSTVPHLATIDALLAREFPAEHGTSDLGIGGPGYFIRELRTEGAAGDASGCGLRELAEEQCEAERDGLGISLDGRYGAGGNTVPLSGLLIRGMERGEHIPEPWAYLSALASDARVWETGSRLIALAVSRLDPAQPPALLVAVTVIDLP